MGLDKKRPLSGPRKTSQVGIDLIKAFEGLELKAYKDAVGVVTIGYGHTRTAKMGQEITPERAEELLRADLRRFEEGVSRVVAVPLTQAEYDALISFSFNVGLGALQKSTLLRKLNRGDRIGAADEFPRWNKAGGQVLRGLIKRRNAERHLFLGNG